MVQKKNTSIAVVGAGDYIGSAIARRFAREGHVVFAGRRNGDKLAPLVAELAAEGHRVEARTLDARESENVAAFLDEAEAVAPLETVIFNVGANVNFPILETTDRVFRKVWEMACFSGFATAREAIRIMLPRARGNLFFTGATASLRGGSGFTAFSSAKSGLRAVAEAVAREIGPQGIHVAHLVIDAGVDTQWVRQLIATNEGQEAIDNLDPGRLMRPESVADAYWALSQQPSDAWTFQSQIRPFGERW